MRPRVGVWMCLVAFCLMCGGSEARPVSDHCALCFMLFVVGPTTPGAGPGVRAELDGDDESRAVVFFSDSGVIAVDDSSRVHVVDSGHEVWSVGCHALQDTGAFVLRGRAVQDSLKNRIEVGWELRGTFPIPPDSVFSARVVYERHLRGGRLWRPKGYEGGWVPIGEDERVMDSDIDQRPMVMASSALPAASVPSGQRVESLISGTACLDTTGRVVLFRVAGARDTTLGAAVREWLNGHWTFLPARSRGRAVSDCIRIQVPTQ